jgi:predicted lipid carrier protein YhbT
VPGKLAAGFLNYLFKEQGIDGQMWLLNGKRIRIDILDADTRLNFIIKRGHLYHTRHQDSQEWNVCIRGKLEHFWQLAGRIEDPDTLFFNRLLQIEGETETGLYIKNLLDSIEYEPAVQLQAVLGSPIRKLITGKSKNAESD